MSPFSQISLVGSGAWGTTIANVLAKKGHLIRVWDQNEKVITDISTHHINCEYLPGIELSANLLPSGNLLETIKGTDLLIIAVPSKYLPDILSRINGCIEEPIKVLALTKGLLFEDKPLLVSDLIQKYCPGISLSNFAILSGPNFALEIAQDLPSATVVAGLDLHYLQALQTLLSTKTLRVYTNTDLLGVQLGGMMKNVIALSAGIIDGLGLGMNLKSALLVRGITEMNRIFMAMGANPQTLYGLSGLGDLIATSMSELSRNHWAGFQIGKGLSYAEILSFGRTIEGINTLPPLLKLAELYSVELPICLETHSIIFQGKQPLSAIEDLMNRSVKPE
jgi:glycerol-3-phosphate dehydrogenase (NAD(P)+)